MKNVITPKKISNKDIIKFFKSKNMESVVDLSKEYRESVNDMSSDYKYRPQLKDLYRLYQIIYLNKRTTVLEFGSGYSSLMFSASLSALQTKYKNKISNLRRNNPFELFDLNAHSIANSLNILIVSRLYEPSGWDAEVIL